MLVRRRSVLLCFAVLAAVVAVPVAVAGPAAAGPDDDFSLTKSDDVGGEALIGEEITYTLTASGTQASNAYLYNLSFRDVLPVGVTFVSADPAPTAVLDDVPGAGETTLVWENVNDLPANSTASIDYIGRHQPRLRRRVPPARRPSRSARWSPTRLRPSPASTPS